MAEFYDSIELDGVRKPIRDTDAARASDLDDVEVALDGKLDKTGGTISGDVTIDAARLIVKNGGHDIKTLPNSGGIGNNYITSDTDLVIHVGDGDDPLTIKASGLNLTDGADSIPIIGVADPTDDDHAANMAYVDERNRAANLYTDTQIDLLDAAKVDIDTIDSGSFLISGSLIGVQSCRASYMRIGDRVLASITGYVFSEVTGTVIPIASLSAFPPPKDDSVLPGFYAVGPVTYCNYTSPYAPAAASSAVLNDNGIYMDTTSHSYSLFNIQMQYRTEVTENDT